MLELALHLLGGRCPARDCLDAGAAPGQAAARERAGLAAAETEAGLSPIAVCVRTFFPACSACRKSRLSSGPVAPAS